MSPTEQAAEAAINAACAELRLPSVREHAGTFAERARKERISHRGFLAELLGTEVEDRAARRRTRRISEARFPRAKTLAGFNLGANRALTSAQIAHLASTSWIEAGEPVVFLGDSGTGKTHLLIGTGIGACEAGLRVRYTTMAALANELAEAADDRSLSKMIGRYARLDLLLVDELGYVHLDPRGAELIFQVITERDERASVAVATNLPFSEWASMFTDQRLCAAIVDRLTFAGHIIETGTTSYRLRATKQKKGGPKTS